MSAVRLTVIGLSFKGGRKEFLTTLCEQSLYISYLWLGNKLPQNSNGLTAFLRIENLEAAELGSSRAMGPLKP